jgi:manganese/zinc/iron transport system permease protein
MGVVFTTLFAIGLVLIVQAADHVDLDPGCVLYGAIELTPLDTVSLGSLVVPRAVVVLGSVLLANMAFVALLYKELKISSFDPQLATTQGINATLMHYLLMTFVAITVVASFEAIGSILVIAMLIVPAAAAHLLTDRLGRTIVLAMVFAGVCAGLGHVAAITLPRMFGFEDTSTSGMMATTAGALFVLTWLLAPRYGLLSKGFHRLALSVRIAREDALGLLYRLEEHGVQNSGQQFSQRLRDALSLGPVSRAIVSTSLVRSGLVHRDRGMLSLSNAGRIAARDLVRSHRLWERYLVEELGLRPDHVHATAMRLEHITDQRMQQVLASDVATNETDPHGKQIPNP